MYGSMYLSLTGGHRSSGTGSVQLACLGMLLQKRGFRYIDFGMQMEYKIKLGAKTVPRDQFLRLTVEEVRNPPLEFDLPFIPAHLVFQSNFSPPVSSSSSSSLNSLFT